MLTWLAQMDSTCRMINKVQLALYGIGRIIYRLLLRETNVTVIVVSEAILLNTLDEQPQFIC